MVGKNIYYSSKFVAVFCQVACIIISGTPSEAAEDLRLAHACSAPYKMTYSCERYNTTMVCAENERILIREAVYGFRSKHLSACDVTDRTCEQGTECCPMYEGDYTVDYGVGEKYSVYKTCSWKQKCTQQTQAGRMGKQTSIYSTLKYDCVKERPVLHFCREANVTGKHINIIFDGQTETDSSPVSPGKCVCDLIPLSGRVRYTINAPDLRLMSLDEGCDSESVLTGVTNTNVTCLSKFTNGTSSRLLLGERYIRLAYKLKPEFIWIKIDVDGDRWSPVSQTADTNQLTVRCYKSEHQQSAAESPVPSKSSNKVPVPAIVIPVVLVAAGLGVIALFLLRKRHVKRKPSFKDSVKANSKLDKEPVQSVKYFDNLFAMQGAMKTDDNYIVLESENTYDSIKPEDVKNSLKTNKTDYEGLETISCNILQAGIRQNTELDPNIKNNDSYMDAISAETNAWQEKQETDRHDYLALEHQIEGLEMNMKDSETNYPQREPDLGTHDYLAVEPHNRVPEMDLTNSETKHPQKDPAAGMHDYLVLEPQSLYLSSDVAGLSNTDLSEKSLTSQAEKSQQNNSLKADNNYFVFETPKSEGWSDII